jgi:hypothetical protein
MNGTPKRALQITPTRPASTRNQAPGTSRRSNRPDKPTGAPRPRRRGPGPQTRHPRAKPVTAPHPPGRRRGPQSRRSRKPSMEHIARLVVSAVTALAQLLNAIHRIRTGHGPS